MRIGSIIWGTLKAVALLILLLLGNVIATAATVRGRVDRVAKGRRNPAVGVPVTLSNGRGGRSSPAYSNQNGMYYLQNIPPGTYNLEIWTSRDPHARPVTYVIKVSEPLTDIPAIGF
jgi:Carboxypeptidase regulatory-like domain